MSMEGSTEGVSIMSPLILSARISTNQTKSECMQNLLNEIEIHGLDLAGAGNSQTFFALLSGSLIRLAGFNGNPFRGCFFNLRKR